MCSDALQKLGDMEAGGGAEALTAIAVVAAVTVDAVVVVDKLLPLLRGSVILSPPFIASGC